MVTRTTKIQLLLFVIITLVGVSYVGFNYAGLGTLFGERGCVVSADFPDSGGIFTTADVTYRGVSVGKVGSLHLLPDGVRVDLDLTSCAKAAVPASAVAIVSDRSPVGEQYVNLVPPNGDGPFLTKGAVLPMQRNKLPIATQVLLTNLDALSRSVPTDALGTTITELGNIFNGRGPALQRLLDAGSELLNEAAQNLPQTISLIENAHTVLQTQLDEGSSIAQWARSLNQLTATLKQNDAVVRNLLDTAPDSLSVVQSFINQNSGDLGALLANLSTTGSLVVKHLDGVEQIFELYPLAVAGGFTVTPGDGTAHFGLVINPNDPQDCVQGYGGTARRQPGATAPAAPNVAARCTLPASSPSSIRGAQHAVGGDPVYTGAAGTVYPRTTTSSGTTAASGGAATPVATTTAAAAAASAESQSIPGSIKVGSLGGGSELLGDSSWISVLTDGLH